MSIVGLIMNLMLTGLLAAALVVGLRLNRRLKVLRDSHDGFEAAVRDLNLAAARAEQGLADLRAATDEATDMLADRIEKGRALAARLERQTEQLGRQAEKLDRLAANPPPLRRRDGGLDDPMAERRLGALLAAAREARPARTPPSPAPTAAPARRLSEDPGVAVATRPATAPAAAPASTSRLSGMQAYVARAAEARRHAVDDDLFDDEPMTLSDVIGARS